MKLCIYHGNCADGFGAAWVVRKAFGDDVAFHAGFYGEAPPSVADRDVIIVDFSYKLDVLLGMSRAAKSLVILDHHKTAAADLADMPAAEPYGKFLERAARFWGEALANIGATFDMERSGAMIAWEYFFPGKEPPLLLRHIQDRDLWLFKLDGTREIQASLFSFPYDFEVWDRLMSMDVATLRAEGMAIERKHHKDIAELIGVTKRRMRIGGHNVPVANLPYTLSSDAGHAMAKGEAFAACYWDTPNGRVFSLRSAADGLDVAEIASGYGGGGHRAAAGFQVPFEHELAHS